MSDIPQGITFHPDADIDAETRAYAIRGALRAVLKGKPWHGVVTAEHPGYDRNDETVTLGGMVSVSTDGDDLELLPSDGERTTGYRVSIPMARVVNVTLS